jgi:hypothetical protein
MAVLAFLDPPQGEVIEKILREHKWVTLFRVQSDSVCKPTKE